MKIQSIAQKMQEVNSSVIYTYKGTVENYSDLPTENLSLGDVYNIANADRAHDIDAGDNVAWTGTEWDNLSGIFDTSAFIPIEEVEKLITVHSSDTSAHTDIRKAIPTTYAASDTANGDALAAKELRTTVIEDLDTVANTIVFFSSSTTNNTSNLPDGIEAPWFGSHMGCGTGKIQVIYAKNGMFSRYCDANGTWSSWLNPINAYGNVPGAATAESLNTLKRDTDYEVGDIAYCDSKLPSWARLICTTAGTTASTDITVISTNEGDTITDGTVVWTISDVKHAYYVE